MHAGERHVLAERLRGASGANGLPALAQLLFRAVAAEVPFTFGCFATTDPTTGLISWSSKSRPLGVGDEEFAAAEYGSADVNSLAEIAQRARPVGVLSIDTAGRPASCRRFSEFLAPRFGFTDELRVVFRSRGVSWGVLALYRGTGEPLFTAGEVAVLAPVTELVADAIRQILFRTGPGCAAPDPAAVGCHGPAVLIIDARDRVTHVTPAARSAIEELGGFEHGSLLTCLLAAATAARTAPERADTRAYSRSGRWLSVRAAALDGTAGEAGMVLTIEPTPRGQLSRLALAARGLTAREEDVAVLVLQGADTRAIATALHLSPHTVQDHLKAIFAKLGVNSRREVIAQLVLDR